MESIRKKTVSGLFAFLLVVQAPPGFTASNAWEGTWKLSKEKSQLGGPSLTIAVLSKGEFQIVTRSFKYKLICDGKYRPVLSNRALACLKATATTMDVAEMMNGKRLNTVHRAVSSDGDSLIQTMVMTDERGLTKTTQRVFVRYAKSSGLAGAWKDTNDLDRQPQLMVTELTGSMLRLSFPVERQYTEVKLDGTDAPTHGVFNGARVTLSVRPEGAQKLLTVQKLNGTVVNQGMLILSSDTLSITEETWKPEAPAVKTTLVYVKR